MTTQQHGWRVVWRHAVSKDVFTGEFWQERSDAEYIAQTLIDSGWCRDVRIRRAHG